MCNCQDKGVTTQTQTLDTQQRGVDAAVAVVIAMLA